MSELGLLTSKQITGKDLSKISRFILGHIKTFVPLYLDDWAIVNLPLKPEEINDGFCNDFAEDIKSKFPEAEILWGDDIPDEEWKLDEEWMSHFAPYHCFVRYNGLYYDAETPYGVEDPKEIPYYKRDLNFYYKNNNLSPKIV